MNKILVFDYINEQKVQTQSPLARHNEKRALLALFFVVVDVACGQRNLIRLCHRNEVEMCPLLSAKSELYAP